MRSNDSRNKIYARGHNWDECRLRSGGSFKEPASPMARAANKPRLDCGEMAVPDGGGCINLILLLLLLDLTAWCIENQRRRRPRDKETATEASSRRHRLEQRINQRYPP